MPGGERAGASVRSGHLHPALAGQPALAPDERGGQVRNRVHCRGVVLVIDELVAARQDRPWIDRTAKLDTRHAAHLGRQLHRPQERLARYAPVVLAFTAREAALDHRRRQAVPHRALGRGHPDRARAYHDHIEVI